MTKSMILLQKRDETRCMMHLVRFLDISADVFTKKLDLHYTLSMDRTLETNTGTRISWVDEAKGIAILLTIIGHTVAYGVYGSMLRGAIYSFHMPLFFILGGITVKVSSSGSEYADRCKRAFFRLIPPALITHLILLIKKIIDKPARLSNSKFWHKQLLVMLYASGVKVHLKDTTVALMGAQWFFFAFFIAKITYELLASRIKSNVRLLITSLGIGIVGVVLGSIQWLPFSADVALAVVPFFYFGNVCIKRISVEKKAVIKFLVCAVLWAGTLIMEFPDHNSWTYLELAARRYSIFPLSYLTAVAGSICVIEAVILFEQMGATFITRPLSYIGKNSLYLFCVHILDGLYVGLWSFPEQGFWDPLVRIVVDLVIFLLLMQVRYSVKILINNRKKQ